MRPADAILRKNLINTLDARLRDFNLDDVELSVRALHALKECGARTLYEAQMALIDRSLADQYGVGPQTVREVEDAIVNVTKAIRAKANTRMHKSETIDDALKQLSNYISADEYYSEDMAIYLKSAIHIFVRRASHRSKAYLFDAIIKNALDSEY